MSSQKRTFATIVAETRTEAAQHAWDRARLASQLRHTCRATGRGASARCLAQVKAQAIALALKLAPECVRVRNDPYAGSDYPLYVWKSKSGRSGLHLPKTAIAG